MASSLCQLLDAEGNDKIVELLSDVAAENGLVPSAASASQACHMVLSQQYYNSAVELSGMISKQYHCVLASKTGEAMPQLCALAQDAPSTDLPVALPAEAQQLFAALSADSAAAWGWSKLPSVVVQGPLLLDELALTNLEFVGLPLTPAGCDKPAAEQLEDLFRSHPYPGNKTYYVHGRYFLILGSSLADVDATFGSIVRRVLQGRRFGRTSSTDNALAQLGFGITATIKRLGSMLQRSRSDPAPAPESGALSPSTASLSTPASPPAEPAFFFKKPCRTSNEFHRIPTFQTGLRPW